MIETEKSIDLKQEIAMPDYVDVERMEKVEHRLTLVENALLTVIRQNDTTNMRLSAIEGRMDKLEDNQQILAEQIRLNGERIGSLEGHVVFLGQRVGSLEGRIGSLEGRVDSLEGHVISLRDEMHSGFDRITATLATILQRLP